jgi:DNA-binding LacI/PurR family transcriptional regulator
MTESTAQQVTLEAVARHARVSRQTISNALNAPHRLAPATLVRAQQSIDELGYRPNQAARALRTRSSRLIGFRIEPSRDGVNGAVLDRFLHALCEAARDKDYNVLLFSAADDASEIAGYDDLLRRGAVDAFVLAATHRQDARAAWLVDRRQPFVTFGRPWGEKRPRHAWVDIDGAAGTEAAVEHLIARGHRRIGFLGWPPGSGVGDDRLAGWARALTAHRLPQRGLSLRGEDGEAAGAALATKLLRSAHPPTALVCASDSLALGALHAIQQSGGEPGRDVAVTGFDDTPIAAALSPGLTSVRQPVEAAATAIVRLLAERMAGTPVPPVGELIIPQLIVRASS